MQDLYTISSIRRLLRNAISISNPSSFLYLSNYQLSFRQTLIKSIKELVSTYISGIDEELNIWYLSIYYLDIILNKSTIPWNGCSNRYYLALACFILAVKFAGEYNFAKQILKKILTERNDAYNSFEIKCLNLLDYNLPKTTVFDYVNYYVIESASHTKWWSVCKSILYLVINKDIFTKYSPIVWARAIIEYGNEIINRKSNDTFVPSNPKVLSAEKDVYHFLKTEFQNINVLPKNHLNNSGISEEDWDIKTMSSTVEHHVNESTNVNSIVNWRKDKDNGKGESHRARDIHLGYNDISNNNNNNNYGTTIEINSKKIEICPLSCDSEITLKKNWTVNPNNYRNNSRWSYNYDPKWINYTQNYSALSNKSNNNSVNNNYNGRNQKDFLEIMPSYKKVSTITEVPSNRQYTNTNTQINKDSHLKPRQDASLLETNSTNQTNITRKANFDVPEKNRVRNNSVNSSNSILSVATRRSAMNNFRENVIQGTKGNKVNIDLSRMSMLPFDKLAKMTVRYFNKK